MRDMLLIIVRHGDYGSGYGDEPLSAFGIEQMQGLRKAINSLVAEKAKKVGQKEFSSLFFSFSQLKRAIQSAQELHRPGCYIIITDEDYASRRYIPEPKKILEKVLGFADHCGASVVVIVAHGEMPAVIAETAREFVTQKKFRENLPFVSKGRGFVVNMGTGEVTPIGWDDYSPDEKLLPAQERESNRPIIKAPPRSGQVVIKDDGKIPF